MIGIVQPCKGITKMVTHSNVLYRAVNFAYKRIIAGTEKKQNFITKTPTYWQTGQLHVK